MNSRHFTVIALWCTVSCALASAGKAVASEGKKEDTPPAKVYVPYKELTGVFEKEQQGVFLPYKEFRKLWHAAQGKPADISEAPFEYLISTARFHGEVKEEIATVRLELTIDILADGWVQVPVGLGEVAVSEAACSRPRTPKSPPCFAWRTVSTFW